MKNAILYTIDVVGLHPNNIPHKEALHQLKST